MDDMPTSPGLREVQGAGDHRGQGLAGKAILLADGDPGFVAEARHVLGDLVARVAVVDCGAAALQHLQVCTYDLANINLSCRRIDGFRMIAYIRHTSAIRDLPIITTADANDEEAVADARHLDVELFRTKPLNWDAFVADVAGIFAPPGDGVVVARDTVAETLARHAANFGPHAVPRTVPALGPRLDAAHTPPWSKNWAALLRKSLLGR